MSINPIDQAIENLAVQGIFLRSTTIKQHEDFDPRLGDKELLVQTRAGTTLLNDLEVLDDKTGEKHQLFKVHFNCGLRLSDPGLVQGEDPASGVVVEISATFVAEYLVKPGAYISDDAKDAFSKQNVGYHVWPYWREYVQSSCGRLGLPIVNVPLYRVSKANQKKPQARPRKKTTI
jgi:hypothetical protein